MVSFTGGITGEKLIRHLEDGRSSCFSLDDDHFFEIEQTNAAEYLDRVLKVYRVTTHDDLLEFLKDVVSTCRILNTPNPTRPVHVRHALRFARIMVDLTSGARIHIRSNLSVNCTYEPTEAGFKDLIARVLVALAESWGLMRLRFD